MPMRSARHALATRTAPEKLELAHNPGVRSEEFTGEVMAELHALTCSTSGASWHA